MMVDEKEMQIHMMKSRAYNLDMADKALDELIYEFLAEGNAPMASFWASMRMHLYQCGKALGIDDKKRSIKMETIREGCLDQQLRAFKLLSFEESENKK